MRNGDADDIDVAGRGVAIIIMSVTDHPIGVFGAGCRVEAALRET